MKFLVVDDSATMRRIVVNSLQRIGFTDIVEAEDGADALEKVSTTDFVITDWNMPKLNGADFTRAVRGHDATKRLPILMVTARSVREDILTALDAGVDSYIVKPFTPQVLREKIDAVLAARAA
jgi:two-component system chemotaxis response regulator CheY